MTNIWDVQPNRFQRGYKCWPWLCQYKWGTAGITIRPGQCNYISPLKNFCKNRKTAKDSEITHQTRSEERAIQFCKKRSWKQNHKNRMDFIENLSQALRVTRCAIRAGLNQKHSKFITAKSRRQSQPVWSRATKDKYLSGEKQTIRLRPIYFRSILSWTQKNVGKHVLLATKNPMSFGLQTTEAKTSKTN